MDRVDLVVSASPLGKGDPSLVGPVFADRLAVLSSIADSRPWLSVRTTSARLVADVVAGYDAVVLGADKWLQVIDPAWYGGSVAARDAAVAGLPRVLLALRHGHALEGPLPAGAVVLDVDDSHLTTSSSQARSGRLELMAPEAAAFDRDTGAWSDPCRYRSRRGD